MRREDLDPVQCQGQGQETGDQACAEGQPVLRAVARRSRAPALREQLGVRRPHRKVRADPQPIAPVAERLRDHRLAGQIPPGGQRTGDVGMVVGQSRDQRPPHGPGPLPVPHRLRRGGEPAPHRRLVQQLRMRPGDPPDIALGASEVIVDAFPRRDVVRAGPHLPTGIRGRTAEHAGGLEQRDRPAEQRCSHRRRQPGQATAGHDHPRLVRRPRLGDAVGAPAGHMGPPLCHWSTAVSASCAR